MIKISAALVLTDGTVFLGCHSTGNSFYDLPKGEIADGERPAQACIRETREETGLVIVEEDLIDLGEFAYTPQKILHLFLMHTDQLPSLEEMECRSTFVHPYTKKTLPEVDAYRYIPYHVKDQYVTKNMKKVLDQVEKILIRSNK
ncbi:MAG: NUDIX hydrolase [Bacillaceae bacterium]|nr:NUDIX hydrolase [Bacillaceae bacterium]